MATRILVVGDDWQTVPAVRDGLTSRGYELLAADNGTAGLEMAARHLPDLVVVALALPDMPGTGLIAELRAFSKAPIVALSGPDGAADIVDVLDAGADACLTAPLDLDLLVARLRALQRRVEDAEAPEDPTVLIGHYSLDLAARTVTRRADAPGAASARVRLTRTEWAILEILVRSPCTLVPGPELMDLVWGPTETPKTPHLRFHISKLRHKLEPEPSRPRQLITESGAGYLFKPQSPPDRATGFEPA